MVGSAMMYTSKRLVLIVKVIPWFVPMMGGLAVKYVYLDTATHYPLLTKLLRLMYTYCCEQS